MKLFHYVDRPGLNVLGIYVQGVHKDIPQPALEVSEEKWAEYIRNPHGFRVDVAAEALVSYEAPPPTPQEVQAALAVKVKAEVSRRIIEVASTNTQLNLAAAAAGGVLTADQTSAYLDGLSWISAMRQMGKDLAAQGSEDFSNDEHWPEPPSTVVELAQQF